MANTLPPNVFVKSAKIVDVNSLWNGQQVSLILERGKIKKIGKNLKAPGAHIVFEHPNLHVSPGWLDMQAMLCEPGLEHKEDISSGSQAAAFGGFTGLLSAASTSPSTDNRSGIEYILNRTNKQVVDVFPSGGVTKGLKGLEMAEMNDMYTAGAVAFSDHKHSIQNPKLLIKALLYTKAFNGLVIHFPNDQQLSANGQINEGAMSTSLGMKPIPRIAEEIMIDRDLQLLAYTEHKLHFSMVSSPLSLQKIKLAKKSGLQVSCGVSSYHLLLSEDTLIDFDSNFKTIPPLRSKQSISALIKGLKDGTIDVIISDHCPENIENKNCEFDEAAFGIINLQTSFAVAHTALRKHLSLTSIIEKITCNPRSILGLNKVEITEGNVANLTFFDPDLKWEFNSKANKSKSNNSPFFNQPLIGKAVAIYNNAQFQAL